MLWAVFRNWRITIAATLALALEANVNHGAIGVAPLESKDGNTAVFQSVEVIWTFIDFSIS